MHPTVLGVRLNEGHDDVSGGSGGGWGNAGEVGDRVG